MKQCVAFASICFSVASANAAENITINVSSGIAAVTAHEYVYIPEVDHKLSELIWDTRAFSTVNAAIEARITPKTKLEMSGVFGFGGDGFMSDYDWLDDTTADWSHRSLHDHTSMPGYVALDLHIAHQFATKDRWSFNGLAGVKYDSVKWKAFGGDFIYSTEDEGFRDDIFSLDDTTIVISYQQEWATPYLGLSAIWADNKSSLHLSTFMSPLSFGFDKDNHWLRETTFVEKFKPSWSAGIDAKFTHALTDRTAMLIAAGYNAHFTAKGRSKMIERDEVTVSDPDAAGASLWSAQISVGLAVRF